MRFSTVLVTLWLACYTALSTLGGAAANAAGKDKPTIKELQRAGDEALAKGDHAAAAVAFTKLIRADKTSHNYYKRATIYIRQKKTQKALEDLDAALRLDDKFIKARTQRARVRMNAGRCTESVEDYNALIAALAPTDAKSQKAATQRGKANQCAQYIANAERLLAAEDWAQAKAHVSAAMDIAFDAPALQLMRARAHIGGGDYQSAMLDAGRVLKQDSQHLEALLLRGIAYYYMNELPIAKTHFQRGLRTAQDHKELKRYYRMVKKLLKLTEGGDADFAKRKYAHSVRQFTEALAVDETHMLLIQELQLKLCKAHTLRGKAKEALAACNAALAIDDKVVAYWIARGDANVVAEEFEAAVSDMQKAVELDNNSQLAKEGLQRAQLELKKSQRKDYYKILGVQKNANKQQLKKAFRKMALKWHPDKHKTEEEKAAAEIKFRECNEAHEILKDPQIRARYDRGEDVTDHAQQQQQRQQGHPFGGGFGGGNFHFQWGNNGGQTRGGGPRHH